MKKLRNLLIFLAIVLFLSWLNVLAVWYGSLLFVSLLSIVLFPAICGALLIVFFPELETASKKTRKIISFFVTFFLIWIYWILWFDLTLNVSEWSKLDIPLVPISFVKFSHTDLEQCFFLLTHPEKVFHFLFQTIRNGYYSSFGFRPSGVGLAILLSMEWTITGTILYSALSPKEETEKESSGNESE